MRQKEPLCDNASSMGRRIITPQCIRNRPTVTLQVIYHEMESDTLNLCQGCANYVKKDARRYGYTTKQSKIR